MEASGKVMGNRVSNDSCENTSNAVRAIVGPDKEVFSFPDFLRHYVPSLEVPSLDLSKLVHQKLSETLIVPLETFEPLSVASTKARRDESLSSLVDDVVSSLVHRRERQKRLKQDGRNLLSQGYAIGSDYSAQAGTVPSRSLASGVVMLHLNNNVDYCKTSALFRLMHELVGDDIMRVLLLHTSIFIPVEDDLSQPRGNYLQLTGQPLQPTNMQSAARGRGRKTRKRRRRERGPTQQIPKHLEPWAVIQRQTLFYSNTYTPKVGLPSNHILNGPCEPETLLAQILEMQRKDKRRRKHWQKLSERGTDLCREVFRMHQKCDYVRLLEHYCPLPEICRTEKESVTLSQASASHTPPEQVISFLSAVLRRTFPSRFWGSSLNFTQVLKHVETFVKLRRQEQLANKTLLKGIRVTQISWLHGTRNRKLSVSQHATTESLLLCVLRWLFHEFIIPLLRSTFHITESELSQKRVLYYRKPVWSIFRALSMDKLLKKQYKEISGDEAAARLHRQQMGFSRLRLLPKETGVRPIAMLCKREVVKPEVALKGDTVDEYECDLEEQVDTPYGPARKKRKVDGSSAPKNSGSLSTARQKPGANHLSTNTVLNDTFAVLRYEHSKNEDSFGAGFHGLHYFYPRYRRFIEQLKPRTPGAKRMFFAGVDIQHCYDNINQEHLLNVVNNILTEEDYLIQRYSVLYPFESMGRVFRRQKKKVGPPEMFDPFYRTASELTSQQHRAVFTDGISCVMAKKEHLMGQLREHLTSHLVVTKGRYGDRYLLQATGIPQGSVLSSLLCNFYYGNVERQLFDHKFVESTKGERLSSAPEDCSMLARMVDDFMLVTTEPPLLEEFVTTMSRGDPSLGVQINKEKTQVSTKTTVHNEDGSVVQLEPIDDSRLFAWCGMLFDIETGEVLVDYSRFYDGKAGDGLTVERVSCDGEQIAVQMKVFVRPRCIPILFDSLINSAKIQATNFYQLMVFGAVKTAAYLRTSEMMDTLMVNVPFLVECIGSTIVYAYNLIRQRLMNENNGAAFGLKRAIASWLGWQAFTDVFGRLFDFHDLSKHLAQHQPSLDGHLSLKRAVTLALQDIQLDKLIV